MSHTPVRRTFLHLQIASALLVASFSGHATLGQKPSPTPHLHKAKASAVHRTYTVQQMQLETGTLVQEYLSPTGVVFAITWQGPVLPNLQALLGNYFPVLQQKVAQAQQNGQQRGRILMQTPGLVLSSTGRMGDFKGHAYAPDLVPAGVNMQTLLP